VSPLASAPVIPPDTAKPRVFAVTRRDRIVEILVSILIGAAFFLILRGIPDIPGGYDGYRHAKQALRLVTEPRAMFADPWHLAYFWHVPVDVWFGYHVLLAPFTMVFELITAAKLFSAAIFGGIAYVLFLLLRELEARYRIAWVLLALFGSSITLSRATTMRPFLLSVLLTMLAALLTMKDKPVPLAAVSMLHALSYSMFFLVGMAPAVWFLVRRDRRALVATLSCGAGIFLGLLVNPYFPENLRFDVVQASVVSIGQKAHVRMGGELYPPSSWWVIVSSLPAIVPFLIALGVRLRHWRRATPAPLIDLFLVLSGATFLGTLRVVRTADFLFPFAILFAAAVLAPFLKRSRTDLAVIGLLLALPCAANVYLTHRYTLEAPSLARYRGAAAYLNSNAPGELVANTQWNDYQLLFFLNSHNRYLVGIEPTFMYLADPRKYWLWLHTSEDEPGTCDHEYCADADRTDIVAAFRDVLGTRYLVVDHDLNPRVEAILRKNTNVTEVFRDVGLSVYRIDS
jgi:hypothetical protein